MVGVVVVVVGVVVVVVDVGVVVGVVVVIVVVGVVVVLGVVVLVVKPIQIPCSLRVTADIRYWLRDALNAPVLIISYNW